MKNGYTVIIPTMWQSPDCIIKMLNLYCESDYVNEIIIIDNDRSKTINNDILNHSKVKIVTNNRNLYVNPAWNWGVSHSNTEKIIITNDDVVIESFDKLIEYVDLNLKPNQVIGPSKSCFNNPDSQLSLKSSNKKMNWGWGTFMIMFKESFKPIPGEFLIWRGDHIQYILNEPYTFNGVHIETKMSTTINSKKLTSKALKDKEVFLKYYTNDGKLRNFNE